MLYLQDRVNVLETVSWGISCLLSVLLLCPDVDLHFKHSPKETVPESISKTTSKYQGGK